MSTVSLVRRQPVVAYVALALGLSWLVAVPLALAAQGILRAPVPFALHSAASFGPLLAALAVTAAVDGRPGLHDLVARAGYWRIGAGWWLVAVGSPFAPFAVGAVASRLVGGAWPDLRRLGEVNFLGALGPWVLPLWLATFGYGEEVGWRGFALPRLQGRHTALTATLIVAVLWVIWHLPSFFYLPTYVALGLAVLPGFAIGVVLGAILLTWLYISTGGSLLAVAMWHALYDLFSAPHAADIAANVTMSIMVMAWALTVLVVAGPARPRWPSGGRTGPQPGTVAAPGH